MAVGQLLGLGGCQVDVGGNGLWGRGGAAVEGADGAEAVEAAKEG